MKKTLKQYKKEEINSEEWWIRVAIYIGMVQIIVFDRKAWNNNNDFYRKTRLNPYHPVTYLFIFFALIIVGIRSFFSFEWAKDVFDLFKYK